MDDYINAVYRHEVSGRIRVLRCPELVCQRLVQVAGGRLADHTDYYLQDLCRLSGAEVEDRARRGAPIL